MTLKLDHVSIAVRDLAQPVGVFQRLGLVVGERREFETENTVEVYVDTAPVKLLLQQPRTMDGPLASHIQRRGAGFHHLGFTVPDMENFIGALAGSGWLMTPSSLLLRRRAGTIWLVRPDAGLLCEIVERRDPVVTSSHHTFASVALVMAEEPLARRLFSGLGLAIPPEPDPDPARACATFEVPAGEAGLAIHIPTPGASGPLHGVLALGHLAIHHVLLPVADLASTGRLLADAGVRMMTDTVVNTPHGPRWYIHPAATGGALVVLGPDAPVRS